MNQVIKFLIWLRAHLFRRDCLLFNDLMASKCSTRLRVVACSGIFLSCLVWNSNNKSPTFFFGNELTSAKLIHYNAIKGRVWTCNIASWAKNMNAISCTKTWNPFRSSAGLWTSWSKSISFLLFELENVSKSRLLLSAWLHFFLGDNVLSVTRDDPPGCPFDPTRVRSSSMVASALET